MTIYGDGYGNYFDEAGKNLGPDVVFGPGGLDAQGGQPAPLAESLAVQWRAKAGLAQPADVLTAMQPAQAQLKAVLDKYQLGGLADWAWTQLTSGASQDEILASLRDQSAYKARFAGNDALRAKGLQPLSEAEYLSWEKQAASLMKANGLPAGFYDSPDDFAKMIGSGQSISELNERVQIARTFAVNDPSALPEEAQQFRELYGLGTGDMAAYLLDPEKATPLIARQANAAQNATRAKLAGFGQLTSAQAERVGGLTSSVEQAAQGFQQLARMNELFAPLPGEAGATQITKDDAIAAQFAGDQAAQAKISRRQKARLAEMGAQAGDFGKGGAGTATSKAL